MNIIDNVEMERMISRMAYEIMEKCDIENIAIVGIQRRGVSIAKKIAEKLGSEGVKADFGILDITLYRDDLSLIATHPVINGTDIHFQVENKTIVLVDDVLYTGRTVRAAIEALMEMGRPKAIRLAVLIDRGHRELPIGADVIGKVIPTSQNEVVHVNIQEFDGKQDVTLEKR